MKRTLSEERKALGTFLAARRGRLQPDDVGQPQGRRRTPGLRREEVALLAGVSVSWYTWLEQGRDISASAAALERVANALRLDRAELSHLFALSSRPPPIFPTGEQLSDGLVDLVQSIDPIPAYIRNTRFDILAWNPAVAKLFVDFGELAPHERNTLHLAFLYPPYRDLMRDWKHFARSMLSVFRAARAQAFDKDPFDALIEDLQARSDEFQAWWAEDEVQSFEAGVKRLSHPTRGLLDLTYVVLVPQGQPNLSFVTYSAHPAGSDVGS